MSRPRRDIESPRGKRQKYTRSSGRERSSSRQSYKSGVTESLSASIAEPKIKGNRRTKIGLIVKNPVTRKQET